MSLAFLTAASVAADAAPAESPFATMTASEGAAFAVRDGWRVAARFASAATEEQVCAEAVGWADLSHLGKLELQAAPGADSTLAALGGGLRLGTAVRDHDASWLLVTPARALVICAPAQLATLRERVAAVEGLSTVDVTAQLSALRLGGPLARETLARLCALDLRDQRTPVGAFVPGSVARTPGYVVRETEDRFLVLTGSAYAEYIWTVLSDAGRRLGGRPVGVDALDVPVTSLEGAHA